jgi:hypothetical protein
MTNIASIFTKSDSTASRTAPEWPVEPSSKLVESIDQASITDANQLKDRVVEVIMVGGTLLTQGGDGIDPLVASPVIIHVDRVKTGARGGLEGRLIVSPRQAYPHLKDAFDDAGVDWYHYGNKVFIPANELKKGFLLPECKLVENDDATNWIRRAGKVQRTRDAIAKGGSGFLDRLSIPKVLGLTGATTAAAVVAYYAYNRAESRSSHAFEDQSAKPTAPRLAASTESSGEKAKPEEGKKSVNILNIDLSEGESSKPFVKGQPSQAASSGSATSAREDWRPSIFNLPKLTENQEGKKPASATSTLSNQVTYSSSQVGTAPANSTQTGAQLISTGMGASQSRLPIGCQQSGQNGLSAIFVRVESILRVLPPSGFVGLGLANEQYPEVRLNFWNIITPEGRNKPLRELVVYRLPATTTPELYIQGLQQMMNAGRLPGITYAEKQCENGGDVIAMTLDPCYKPTELLNWIATATPIWKDDRAMLGRAPSVLGRAP